MASSGLNVSPGTAPPKAPNAQNARPHRSQLGAEAYALIDRAIAPTGSLVSAGGILVDLDSDAAPYNEQLGVTLKAARLVRNTLANSRREYIRIVEGAKETISRVADAVAVERTPAMGRHLNAADRDRALQAEGQAVVDRDVKAIQMQVEGRYIEPIGRQAAATIEAVRLLRREATKFRILKRRAVASRLDPDELAEAKAIGEEAQARGISELYQYVLDLTTMYKESQASGDAKGVEASRIEMRNLGVGCRPWLAEMIRARVPGIQGPKTAQTPDQVKASSVLKAFDFVENEAKTPALALTEEIQSATEGIVRKLIGTDLAYDGPGGVTAAKFAGTMTKPMNLDATVYDAACVRRALLRTSPIPLAPFSSPELHGLNGGTQVSK